MISLAGQELNDVTFWDWEEDVSYIDSLQVEGNQRIEKEASGSLSKWMRKFVICLIRCSVVKRRVSSLLVVIAYPATQPLA